MRKNTKAILVLLCALVMVLTGIGMPVASAATTLDGLTVDHIFDSLGESLQYGVVAHRWEQDAHSETSACVDELYKIAGEEFSNSDITYHYALDYKLKADISAPADGSRDLSGMSFALYTYDGEKYVRCKDTKIDVTESVSEITLEWTISGDLRNERLFVFQTADTADGNGYVPNGATNGAYVVTYGPSISASAQNEIYLGKIILPGKKNQNDAINIFQAPFTHGPNLVLGSDVQLYYSFTENEGDLTPLKLDAIPESEKDVSIYVDYFYYSDPQNPATSELLKAQMKLEDVKIRDGEILLVDKDGTAFAAEITQESRGSDYVASTLLKDAKDFSVEMGNMGGGEISDKSIPPKGPSTVTSTLSTENGSFISLYDVEIGEDGVFCVKDDMGWKDVRVDSNNQVGIPIQENEYVVINLICPADPDSVVYMAGKNGGSENITYFYEEGQKTGEQAEWDRSMQTHDSGVSQRVIYNFVYVDENGLMQPYQGTVIPHSCHGGTLLVPEGRVELHQEVHNGSIIANEVYNKQEIHQRTMATQGRSTWVVMDGGYLTLQKASIGYDNRWHDMSKDVDLSGAVFGIYTDEDCSENSLVATMTTDEEGKATSELLSAGTYWVKEITPLKDHNLSSEVVKVTVVAGEPVQVRANGYNELRDGYYYVVDGTRVWIEGGKLVNQQNNGSVSIRVVKNDDFGNPLQGAVFGIYKTPVYEQYFIYQVLVDCKDQIGTAKTNHNGVAVFENVPLGYNESTYYIKEISAPEGYQRSDYIATVNLPSGRDESNRDQLITADGVGYNYIDEEPFVNVTIRGNIALKKVDAARNTPLRGAEFTVYDDPACGEDNIVGTMTTDKDGVATSVGIDGGKDLLPGTYYVVETTAPDGYKAPTDKNNWNQDVPRVYTVTVQYGKTVDVLSGEVLAAGKTPTAITNDKVTSIYGTKEWKDDNNKYQVRPENVKFNLYRNGEWIKETRAYKDNWTFSFTDLPVYDDNGEEYTYTVVEDMEGRGNDYHTYVNEPDEDGNLTVVNSIKRTKINVIKVWEDKLQNIQRPNQITYLLYQLVDGKLEPMPGMNGAPQMQAVGYANSYTAEFTNLPNYNRLGEEAVYVIKEAESDEFVLIDSVSEKVENNQNANEYNYTLTNRLTVPLKGTKTWVDNSNADGNRPENVELKIFRLDDKAPGGKKEIHLTGKDAVPGVEIIWDKETNPDVWSWKVIGLRKYDDAGNEYSYTVNEVKVPGYKVTVSDDGLNFTNTKTGNLELYKVAPGMYGRQEPLRGAKFNLYYDLECTTPVPGQEKTTDDSGFADFRDLAPGDYYLKEEKAPDFYELMAPNPLKVTVLAGKTVRVNGEDGVIVDNWFGTSTEVTLPVTKKLQKVNYQTNVPENLSKTFEFAIEADEETAKVTGWEIQKNTASVTVTGIGSETTPDKDAFSIKFTEAGTYAFKVKETTPGTGYIKADDTVYTVTYTVAAGQYGRLHATPTINKGNENPDEVTFVNTYGNVYIGGTKIWMDADKSFRLNIDEGTFSTTYLKLYTLNADGSLTEFTALNINGNDPAKIAALNVSVEGDNGNFSWYYYDLPGFDADGNELNYVVKEMTVYGYQTFYVNPSKDYSYKPEDDTALYPRPNKTGFKIYNTLAKSELTINKTVKVEGTTDAPAVDEFQFTITPAEGLTGYHFVDAEGNLSEGAYKATVKMDYTKVYDDGWEKELPVTIAFDNFEGETKDFVFTVKETPVTDAGWTCEPADYEQTVTFTVTRNADDYTVSVTPDAAEAEFTNTYKVEEKTSITIRKHWPTSTGKNISQYLFLCTLDADGTLEKLTNQPPVKYKEVQLPEDVEYYYSWSDLPVLYDENGNEIKYAVIEEGLKGYTTEYWDINNKLLNGYATNGSVIVNWDIKTEVSVTKVWENVAPMYIHSNLYLGTLDANGKFVELADQPTENVTDNADGSQTYTWSNLYMYDADGNEIKYAVIEKDADGYFVSYSNGSYALAGGTITNAAAKGDFSIDKWFSVNPDVDEDLIPDSFSFILKADENNPDGFLLTQRPADEESDEEPIELTDNDSGEYLINLPIKLNSTGDMWNEYAGAYLFDIVFTKAGEYNFTLREDVPEEIGENWVYDTHSVKFTFKVSETGAVSSEKPVADQPMDEGQEEIFYNSLFGSIDLEFVKQWANDNAAIRPVKPEEFADYLTLRYAEMYDANGEEIFGADLEWIPYDAVPVIEKYVLEDGTVNENAWIIAYENLPSFIDGQEVYWSVVEANIPGYTRDYDNEDEEGDAEQWATYQITNTLELTSVTVTKTWQHGFNDVAVDPDLTNYLKLYRKTVADESYSQVKDATPVYDKDERTYTWSELPKYDDKGNEYHYIVKEDQYPGYITLYLDAETGGLDVQDYVENGESIENHYFQTKVLLQGRKNLDGKPSETAFTFELVDDATGEVVATSANLTQPDADEGFDTGDFAFEIVYEGEHLGKTYNYTIREKKDMGAGFVYDETEYKVKVVIDANGAQYVYLLDGENCVDYYANTDKVVFENKSLTSVSVTKEWVGGKYNGTTEPVTLQLFADGVALNGGPTQNGNEYTWSGLPMYDDEDGELIVYTVKETTVPDGYTVTYLNEVGEDAGELVPGDAACDGGKIVNTYAAKGAIVLEGEKVLEGRELKADEFSFELKDANGEVLQTKKNDKDGNIVFDEIEYTEADLSKSPIKYTISEVQGSESGMTYAANVAEVTVTLTDNGDGTIDAKADKTKEEIKFVNTYAVDGKLVLQASKSLSGSTLKDGQFEFTLTGEGENQTVQNNGSAVVFAAIEYDEGDIGKTFTYTVAEKAGNAPGYTYDATKYTVVVKVEMKDGKLMPEYTVDGETGKAMTFKNAYEAEGAIKLEGEKVLEGRDLKADEFSFELKDANGKVLQTKKNDKDGNIVFDEIEYTEADLSKSPIKYTISEVQGSENGMTYAANVAEVTVTLTDNGDGTIDAKADKTKEEIKFVNTYAVDGKLVLQASKSLSGSTLKDGQFEFTLTGEGENQTVQNNGSAVVFAAIEYDEGDIGKTFTYTVAEKAGNAPGYTYDATKYTVVVKVEMKDGKLMPEYTVDGETGKAMTFKNAYAAKGAIVLEGTKVLEGRDLKADEFSFELKDANGEVLQTKKNDKDGSIVFDAIEYTEADLSKSPIKYTISEVHGSENGMTYAANVAEVTVTLTDNGDGTIDAEADKTKEEIKFVNTYAVDGKLVLQASKSLSGSTLKDGQFEFTLTGEGENQTVQNNGSAVVFAAIEYDEGDIGKTFTYTVAEKAGNAPGYTYDATKYTVVVKVEMKDGKLMPEYTVDGETGKAMTFKNAYEAKGAIVLEGTKVLEGRDLKADEFSFELKDANGEVLQTKKNDKDGNIVFDEIEYTEADLSKSPIKYTISEVQGSESGMTYAANVAEVTVTLTDNGDGTIKAEADKTKTEIKFVNTYEEEVYEAKGSIVLDGVKTLEGRTLKAGEFTFEVKDASDKVVATGANDAAGKIVFTEIKYTEKDAGKTFTYKVYEVKGDLPGVTYAETPVTVQVTVTDNGNGTLTAALTKDSPAISFKNTYDADGKVTFKGAKFLLGREFKQGDEFTFELLNEKAEIIDTVTINPTSGTKADFAFKTIEYGLEDAGKTYTYTYRVKEKAGSEEGVTYDDTVYTVTVTVSDAGDGTLKVVASDAADKLNFTNTYLAEGSVLFSGTKTMNGKALEGGDFTFVLTDEAGKEIESVTNDKDGKIVFSAIQYKLEDAGKTFTYKVSEKNDGKKAVSYDETVYTVTVKVEDDGDGHLKVTTSDNATKLNFTNSYAAKAVLTFNAYKTVNGYKPSVDQVYDFVLLCDDGTEMKAQNKDEMITFGTIAYDEDDIGKTYVYTVKETTEGNELLDVDTAIYQVAVTVKDNGDGNLKLETEILKDGKRASGVVFANTATATLAISKNVKGPGPDKAFDLKVTFIGVDGKELEGVYDYDGDVKGTITSGGVIALKDGQSVTIVGLPEGATYTVEENAGPAYTVTVNGKPVAKAEGTLVGHGKLEFINTVEVTTFSVTKVWEGMDLGEITLTLYADGKQITPQPEVTREGNKYTYYNLPKYNEEGEEIVYSAKERGIDGYIRIYNNVEPYQDVTSFVHDGGTIINREVQEEVHELSFKIRKVWTGVEATEEIPAITLILYCNGEKMDVPTPKPDSEGWYRYYDLPKTVNGQIAVYTVEEVSIPGFTVTYKTASGEIVEQGVNGGEIVNAKIPQTGDPATLGLWLAMMGASAVLLTMLQRRRKA